MRGWKAESDPRSHPKSPRRRLRQFALGFRDARAGAPALRGQPESRSRRDRPPAGMDDLSPRPGHPLTWVVKACPSHPRLADGLTSIGRYRHCSLAHNHSERKACVMSMLAARAAGITDATTATVISRNAEARTGSAPGI